MSRNEDFVTGFATRFGGTTEWADMHPHELAPHTVHSINTSLRDHPDTKARINEIAESIKAHGWQHDPALPIHLVHDSNGTMLMNGNHRAQALVKAGYTDKVRVAVTRR